MFILHYITSKWPVKGLSALNCYVLLCCVVDGNIDCVDSTGKTPLMLASVCGWIDVVRFLLERGASVDVTDEQQGASALHMVCSVGHRNVVEALIEYGADVDAISQARQNDVFWKQKQIF